MERNDEGNSTGEIAITEAMEHAGFDVLDDWTGILDKGTLARAVYTAMVRAKVRRNLSHALCAHVEDVVSRDAEKS